MSVIAWDIETVVADRQMTAGDTIEKTTKLFKKGGVILGFVGAGGLGHTLIEWYLKGAKQEDFPVSDDKADLIVFKTGKAPLLYEGTYTSLPLQKQGALGTGQTPAQTALTLGHTAKEAVDVACKLNIYCGQGTTQFKR